MAYSPNLPPGSATSANSAPVVIASDQSAIPITDNGGSVTVDVAALPLPSGAATLAEQQSQTTALQLLDDAVVTDGATAGTKLYQVGGTDGTNAQIIKTDASGELQIDVLTMPTVAVTQSGTWDEIGINDSGNSITVDAPIGAPVNTQIGDGTRTATIRDTGSSDSLNVSIVDASGNQITNFAGGTEYTEGDTDVSITGTAILLEAAGNTLIAAPGTTADGLLVNLGSNNDVTVTGTVTANAGTNLNTSSLALETTANSIKTAVEIIDNAISGNEMQVDLVGSIPAGTNNIGDVDVLTLPAPLTITGGGVEASALRVTIANDSTGVVSIDDNGGSLTVDGTVAATQSGTWNVTNISGTVSLPTGASTLAEQQTQTTSLQLLDDTVATDGTATPTKGILIAGQDGTNAQTIKTDANGELQVDVLSMPTVTVSATDLDVRNLVFATDKVDVSGSTLAANSGVDIGDVTINNASGGSAVNIQDGGNSITVDGSVSSTLLAGTAYAGKVRLTDGTTDTDIRDLTNSNALNVAIVDAAGDQITSFGGGTQYTEGDADASITGTATLMEVGSNILQPIQGTVVDGLLVNLGANNDVSVSGAVTANAGTNLNTSALSLEATQSSIKTSVELLDDSVATIGTSTYLEATTKGLIVGAIRRDADTSAVNTDNEIAPLQVDASGRLKVEIFDGGDSHTVDGTVAATQSGAWNVTNISGTVSLPTGAATETTLASALTSVQLIDDGIATTGSAITTKGMAAVGTDGTNARILKTDASGELQVDVLTMPVVAVSQSGTWDEVGINDSGNSITVDAPVGTPVNTQISDGTRTATVRDTGASDSLNVSIVDGSGNQITSFGGGTEYTVNVAAPADPVGATFTMERDDQLSTLTEVEADWTNPRATSKGALWVAIPDTNGDPITSFGGGTQYTEGDIDATITGTATLMEVAGNTLQPIQGTVADGLLVNLGANNDVTVTGTVAATQSGTWNITNISGTVSLPTGASTLAEQQSQTTHLATIAGDTTDIEAAVELIDDTVATLGTTTYTETTTKGLIIGAVRRDADTTLVDTTNEICPLQVDANGRLKVEVFSGEIIPVSLTSTTITGTVASTQSGTWVLGANSGVDIGDVTINNAAGASAVNIQDGGNSITVDGTVTVTGVATETTLSSLLTSSQLIDDSVATFGTTTYTEAATKGLIVGGVRRDADTTLVDTTNEIVPFQMDAAGKLKVEIFDGGDSHTIDGSLTTVSTVTSLTQMNGAAISMNTGVRDTGTQRVTIATNDSVPVTFTGSTDVATQTTLASVLTAVQLLDDTVFTDDTSTHATGTTKGLGVMAVANPTDAAVDANDIGMVAMTLNRALKNDITTIAGTAPTTVGKLDVKAADGDVFVRQATAANLNMTEASAASILTSVQLIDDAIFTAGTSTYTEATSKGALSLAVRRDADTTLADTTNEMTPLQVNAAGQLKVASPPKATYRASTIIPLVAAVTVNVPFLNIIGSATKTVTVKRITVSGMTLTAVGYFTINAEKLSTASTGGTSTTLVATALDTNNAAVTAVVKAYTAAPTKGALVGTLISWRTLWQSNTAAASGTTDYYDFDFGDINGSGGVVLRGVAQELALVFPVVLASAGTLACSIEWTEE